MKKFFLFGIAIAFLAFAQSPKVQGDVVGDTYLVLGSSISGGGVFSHHAFGGAAAPNTLTFSAATGGTFIHRLDDNAFGQFDLAGNALDEIIVLETVTLTSSTATSDSFAVSIEVFSREIGTGSLGADADLGTLTSFVAAGTVVDTDGDPATPGTPITSPLFDVGVGRFGTFFGAPDPLDVTIPATLTSGLAASGFTYDGGTAEITEVDGDFFLFTDGAGGFFDPTSDAGGGALSSATLDASAFFATGDVGADNLVDAPVAGIGSTFNFTITAVPEPSSFAVLAFGAASLIFRRRRS